MPSDTQHHTIDSVCSASSSEFPSLLQVVAQCDPRDPQRDDPSASGLSITSHSVGKFGCMRASGCKVSGASTGIGQCCCVPATFFGSSGASTAVNTCMPSAFWQSAVKSVGRVQTWTGFQTKLTRMHTSVCDLRNFQTRAWLAEEPLYPFTWAVGPVLHDLATTTVPCQGFVQCCFSGGEHVVQTALTTAAETNNFTPPPRVQEPPCARTAPWFRGRIFHITFFCQGNGFFMVLVDVGQLFRCADNISCVLLRVPPSGGTLSVSHSRTYPLNPSPLLSTPSPKQPAPDKETNKSQLNTFEH